MATGKLGPHYAEGSWINCRSPIRPQTDSKPHGHILCRGALAAKISQAVEALRLSNIIRSVESAPSEAKVRSSFGGSNLPPQGEFSSSGNRELNGGDSIQTAVAHGGELVLDGRAILAHPCLFWVIKSECNAHHIVVKEKSRKAAKEQRSLSFE